MLIDLARLELQTTSVTFLRQNPIVSVGVFVEWIDERGQVDQLGWVGQIGQIGQVGEEIVQIGEEVGQTVA